MNKNQTKKPIILRYSERHGKRADLRDFKKSKKKSNEETKRLIKRATIDIKENHRERESERERKRNIRKARGGVLDMGALTAVRPIQQKTSWAEWPRRVGSLFQKVKAATVL